MKNIELHRGCKFFGFTLAEMMVVMLIMAIVLAALAPVMTRKFRHEASGGNGEIVWAFDGDHAIANLLGIANKKAIIANNGTENFADNARLIIQTNGTNTEHISFRVAGNDTRLGKLYLRNNQAISLGAGDADGAGSISIGNSNVTNTNSIVIGTDNGVSSNQVTGQNVIIIGHESAASNNGGIVIGNSANGNTDCISIGNGATTSSALRDSIAIGHEAVVNESASFSTAIGYQTAVGNGATNSLAIGHKAKITDSVDGGIVIGRESELRNTGIIIGNNLKSGVGNTILIGNKAQHTIFGAEVNNADQSTNARVEVRGKLLVANTTKPGSDDPFPGDLIVEGNLLVNGDAKFLGEIQDQTGYKMEFGGYEQGNLSDARLKYVGIESKAGLEQIKQLKPYNYTFKKDEKKTPHVGVIAQDLQKVFPDAVKKGSDGFLSIRMEDMFYAVINAIKELDAKVSELFKQVKENRDKIQQLQAANDKLQKENADLKARLDKIEAKLK